MDAERLQVEFSDRLKKVSQCPLCQTTYTANDPARNPVLLLRCAHTLCQTCVDQLLLDSPAAARCSVCQSELAVDRQSLPGNSTLLDMTQLLASWRDMSCEQHAGKFADVYCEHCQRIMCATCYLQTPADHSGHTALPTSAVAARLHAVMLANLDNLNSSVRDLRRALKAERDFDAAVLSLEQRIRQEESAKIQNVRACALQLLNQLNRLKEEKHRANDLKGIIENARDAIIRIESVIGKPYELVRQSQQLQHMSAEVQLSIEDLDEHHIRRLGVRLELMNVDGNLVGDLVNDEETAAWSRTPQLTWSELNARLLAANDTERRLMEEVNTTRAQLQSTKTQLVLHEQREETITAQMTSETMANKEFRRKIRTLERQTAELVALERTARRVVDELTEQKAELATKLRCEEESRRTTKRRLEVERALRHQTDDQRRHASRLVDELTGRLQEEMRRTEEKSNAAAEQLIDVIRQHRDEAAAERNEVTARAEQTESRVRQDAAILAAQSHAEIGTLRNRLRQAERREIVLRRTLTGLQQQKQDDSRRDATGGPWRILIISVIVSVAVALLWQLLHGADLICQNVVEQPYDQLMSEARYSGF